MEILHYVKLAAVLAAGIILGRWFDQERKALKAKGEPGSKTWLRPPGIVIMVVILLLAALRIYLKYN